MTNLYGWAVLDEAVVQQSVLSKLDESRVEFVVTRLGAVGDGMTDDSAGIQHAIDEAEAYVLAHNTAATVVLPPGKYLLSAPLTLSEDNVHLRGAGGGGDKFTPRGSCLMPMPDFPNDAYVVQHDLSSRTRPLYSNHMTDITIMPGGELANIVHGIHWRSSKGHMDRVYVHGMTGRGLGIQGYDSDYKVLEARFRASTFRGNGTHGIELLGASSDNWFLDCQAHGNVNGAGLKGLGANNYYLTCHFTGNLHNVWEETGCTEALLLGCNFETPRQHSIFFDTNGGAVSSLRLGFCQFNSNALVEHNTYDAIHAEGSEAVSGIILGNVFKADKTNKPRHHICVMTAHTLERGMNLFGACASSAEHLV